MPVLYNIDYYRFVPLPPAGLSAFDTSPVRSPVRYNPYLATTMKYTAFILVFFLLAATARAQLDIDTATAITQNPNLYSLLVNKDGRTLCDRYFNGHHENDLMNDQSLTKSIVSLLIGIAIDKGYIRSVDQPIVDFFPELKKDTDNRKQQITIREIMNQASGLYHENLANIRGFLSLPSQKDIVLNSPLVSDPGAVWHYDNAATHLLSVILTKATGADTYQFAKQQLFDPLGIASFDWPKMNDGYYDGSGLLSIRLRSADMMKVGLLILHHGRYHDRQLVPEKWIGLILDPDKFYNSYWGFEQSTYALCYYHTTVQGTAITYGMGWGGQFLVLIPSIDTVIVANENTADASAIRQSNTFIHRIFPMLLRQLSAP